MKMEINVNPELGIPKPWEIYIKMSSWNDTVWPCVFTGLEWWGLNSVEPTSNIEWWNLTDGFPAAASTGDIRISTIVRQMEPDEVWKWISYTRLKNAVDKYKWFFHNPMSRSRYGENIHVKMPLVKE